MGGFALSGLAAGSAAFNTTATAAINTGLINAGIGLTTQLIFNEGNSSNLDYGSLALDFGFGTLGSFVGAGVAAKTGGGLVSRIGFSTAFEGAFAGGEQVVRNLANGGSWSQDVSSAILSSIVFQGGSEILSNGREILLAGGRLLRAGDNLADDLLGAFGGRRLATPDGLGDDFFRSVGEEVPNGKGGNKFAASTGESISPGGIPDGANRGVGGPITDPSRLIAPTSLDDIRTLNPAKVGNFSDVTGSTVQDVLQRIPEDATMRKLTPVVGGSQVGVEFKWVDSNGVTNRLRIHDADISAPAGTNAASGWIVRHQVGGKFFDPTTGTLRPRNVHKPASPHFDPNAANNTHIPIQTPGHTIIYLMRN